MCPTRARLFVAVIVQLALAAATPTSAQVVLPGREIARRAFASVVLLVTDEEGRGGVLGSGFVIAPHVVVTNYHVVARANAVYGRLVGTHAVHRMGRVVASDAKRDLALIAFAELDAPALSLATTAVATGDTIYVVGNPEGLEGTLSRGIVSSVRASEGLLQIDAAISHGSSGGPVLDQTGAVVGVVVGAIEEGQNLNFAIPLADLVALLGRARVVPRTAAPSPAMLTSTSKQVAVDRIADLYGAGKYDLAYEAAAAAARSWPDDPTVLYYAGLSAMMANKAGAAIDYFRAATRLVPRDGRVWGELARAYWNVGYQTKERRWFEDAVAAGREAIRLGESAPLTLRSIAMSFDELGQHNEAIDLYQRIVALDPAEPSSHLFLANLYHRCERWQDARAAYRRYLDLFEDPSAGVLVSYGESAARCGDRDVAVEAYLAALNANPYDSSEVYTALWSLLVEDRLFLRAVNLAKKELTKHAHVGIAGAWILDGALAKANQRECRVELLQAMAAARPSDIYLGLRIAEVLSDLGRHEDALALGERAKRLSPSNVFAHDRIGLALVALGRQREATAAFERADVLANHANDDMRLWNLFNLYRDAKRFADALAVAKRVELLGDEATFSGVSLLQTAFEDLGRPDDVLPYCEKRLAANPTDYAAVLTLAETHEKAKRYALAASAFKRFIAATPNVEPIALISLGRILELDAKPREAADLYRLALEQPNVSGYALASLAAAHEEFGRKVEAVDLLAKATSVEPTIGQYLFDYARLLADLGRRDDALAQYQRLKQLSTTNRFAAPLAAKLFDLLF